MYSASSSARSSPADFASGGGGVPGGSAIEGSGQFIGWRKGSNEPNPPPHPPPQAALSSSHGVPGWSFGSSPLGSDRFTGSFIANAYGLLVAAVRIRIRGSGLVNRPRIGSYRRAPRCDS